MKAATRSIRELLSVRSPSDLRAELVRGSAGVLAVKLLGVGVSFGAQIVLTNVLGAGGYGRYVYPLAWAQVLLLPAVLGFDTANLRYVAAYLGRSDWGFLRGFLRRSYQITAASSVLIGLVCAAALILFGGYLDPALLAVFWILPLLIPAQALLKVGAATLRSLRHVVLSQLPTSIIRPVLLAGGVLALAFVWDGGVTPQAAMGIELGVAVASVVFVFTLTRRRMPRAVHQARPQFETREWTTVAGTLLLLAGFRVVLNRTDVLMVGAFLGTTEAGIYNVAVRIADLITFGLAAVNVIAAPMFSQLFAQGKTGELQRIIDLATKGIFLATVPLALIVIAAGQLVLGAFGDEFVAGFPVLTVLLAAQIVNALAGSVGYIMAMTGHQKESARVIGICAVVNVVLNLVFIPIWGAIGAAITSVITTIMWNVILVLYIKRHLNLRSSIVVKWIT